MWFEVAEALVTSFWMVIGITIILGLFVVFSIAISFIYRAYDKTKDKARGYSSLKTVTFGDESSVVANRVASIAAVLSVFLIWCIATGSSLIPTILPPPFTGDTQFEYTARNAAGEEATATVFVRVHKATESKPEKLTNAAQGDGFAKDDVLLIPERRSKIIKVQDNDEGGKEDGYEVIAINGQPVVRENVYPYADGEILVTKRGSLSVRPSTGRTMEALYLPPPEQVWSRFLDLSANGYQGVGLWENVFWSLFRVVIGFALGCLFGIPLGFAIGLNSWLRGWFDPIVEVMRPVPPLALIPLVIIWFGIGEQGKISLLFLAALWIMIIAARAGVSGVSISKVHAAYSLGASKRQLLTKVILPNSLPEIFTGARVAMGVCWGTVVAAELVAAEKGAGKMIIAASKFQLTDIVIIGIIIIGVIGLGIDVLMRMVENKLVPWKGKG
ncbi:ABC transporter permease [Amylibacter sp. IMCC11727]|uniref:ABC transporter permease n=1 Tax=Amylibacter sp. IMCC11727 TaxID=3039851 RepID=UPI00244DFEA3|nr:ABC transporter permease [Amylibacter sp. IMCC11727]WGI20991.1 ABC transporter permease [Amylibacter sp. IMCC11727]